MMSSHSPPLLADGSGGPGLVDLEISAGGDGQVVRAPTVQWCDLNFSAGSTQILKGMAGELRPGELSCILGPSGAGKSTLLNVLAGRQRTSGDGFSFSGTIEVGDQLVTPDQMRKLVAYVMQDDSLLPTQTVEESLLFSSALKLPDISAEQRASNVKELLASLGLEKCKDTPIGSALVKGISGGERKRTSVGVELITNPSIVLLDEPTSGLDSYAACELVKELKSLAQKGRIVCCTIHQPSSEVFGLFDQVMCLRQGQVLFQGQNSSLLDILSSAQLPCPSGYNAADWLLSVAQTASDEQWKKVHGLCTARMTSDSSPVTLLQRKVSGGSNTPAEQVTLGALAPRAGFCTQVAYITRREFQNVKRDKKSFGARMGMTLGQAILYAIIFPGVARDSDVTALNAYSKNFNVFGALVGLCIAAFFGAAQPLLLSFPLERPVFLREYTSNMYSVNAYFLGKTIVEVMVTLMQVFALCVITFFILGFGSGFAGFLESVASLWLMAISAGSLALWIGCAVTTPSSAVQLSPAISVPQILFSGLFLQTKDLPVYLQWVQYICALKYGINLLCIVEFGRENRIGGEDLLEQQNIKEDLKYVYIAILLGIFAGFRILALFSLKKKGRYVF